MTSTFNVPLPPGEDGMLGRQCPNASCRRYFKLRPGTGLPTSKCQCPYCGQPGDSSDFATLDQLEYAKSYGIRLISDQIIRPSIEKLGRQMRRINQSQRGPLTIRMSLSYQPTHVPLHHYVEQQVETDVTCDACGLEFAIYGVFASCPDCGRLNALRVCLASLETAEKRVSLSKDDRVDAELRAELLRDALTAGVSAFDAYGKAWRSRSQVINPKAKTNLFQDIDQLTVQLESAGLPGIDALVGTERHQELRWFFQARHVYEHNAGVIDESFIKKLPAHEADLGRLLPLEDARLKACLNALKDLAVLLDERLGRS